MHLQFLMFPAKMTDNYAGETYASADYLSESQVPKDSRRAG